MVEIKILTDQRAVTSSGTPEQLSETSQSLKQKVIGIRIRAKADNTGDVYVVYEDQRASASTEGDILAPGEVYWLDVHDILDGYLDLSRIWIDAANSGDAVSYSAVEAI